MVDRDGSSLYDTNFDFYTTGLVQKIIDQLKSRRSYFNTGLLNSFYKIFNKSNAGVKVRMKPPKILAFIYHEITVF